MCVVNEVFPLPKMLLSSTYLIFLGFAKQNFTGKWKCLTISLITNALPQSKVRSMFNNSGLTSCLTVSAVACYINVAVLVCDFFWAPFSSCCDSFLVANISAVHFLFWKTSWRQPWQFSAYHVYCGNWLILWVWLNHQNSELVQLASQNLKENLNCKYFEWH